MPFPVRCSFFLLLGSLLLGQAEPSPTIKRRFSSVTLGDSVSQTKDNLKQDPLFLYKSIPEINFGRQPEVLLALKGSGFISQATMLFYQQQLYQIELQLNLELISYESMLQRLQQRYQQPQQLDQQQVIWQDEQTQLQLEYPATIKIIDLAALAAMRQAKGSSRELLARDRKAFLDQF